MAGVVYLVLILSLVDIQMDPVAMDYFTESEIRDFDDKLSGLAGRSYKTQMFCAENDECYCITYVNVHNQCEADMLTDAYLDLLSEVFDRDITNVTHKYTWPVWQMYLVKDKAVPDNNTDTGARPDTNTDNTEPDIVWFDGLKELDPVCVNCPDMVESGDTCDVNDVGEVCLDEYVGVYND